MLGRHDPKHLAPKSDARPGRRARRRWGWSNLLYAVGVLTGALLLLFRFILGATIFTGVSMYPSLQSGDLVIYTRLDRSAQYGDIVMYSSPEGVQAKRVVGLPGDELEIDSGTGQIFRNGEALWEPYVTMRGEQGEPMSFGVPASCLIALDDYRPGSIDSRMAGAIMDDQLLGKVVLILRLGG